MAGNLTAMIAAAFSGSAAPPVTSDPDYEYTTLLLPGNGTNGAQNNTFLDSSTNNFTITRNGNTTQGTFSPFSQTGWGNYFGTSGHALGVSNGLIQTTDTTFTMECWVYMLSNPTGGNPNTFPVLMGQMDQTAGTIRLALGPDGNGKLNFYWYDGSNKNVISTTTIQLNTWTHIAVSVNSNAITLYINGTSSGTGTLTNRNSLQNTFYIGNHYTTVYNYVGYVSQVRVVSGVAVYTGNFTPPTSLLTATQSSGTNISAITTGQTKLLTCQSNRFVDNGQGNTSNTPFAITVAGSPSVVAFSPFNPTASWSAATYGGSGYFDGSGDYLVTPSNTLLSSTLLASDFTIEMWIYLLQAPSGGAIWTNSTANSDGFTSSYIYTNLSIGTGKVGVNEFVSSANALKLNEWTHFACVRNGATVYIYVNGQQVASGAAATYLNTSATKPMTFGQSYQTSPAATNAYFSGIRVVSTAVYTGAFSPPSLVPLTTSGSTSAAAYPSTTNVNTSFASSATSLLLNYTNAGIYDATSKNDLETVGNAQISTAISAKWGSGCMAFDGTGDYLIGGATNPQVAFGTGDLTIEWWIYTTSLATTQYIFDTRDPASSSSAGIFIGIGTSGKFFSYIGTSAVADPFNTVISTNVWTHVAFVRNSGAWKLFINGVADSVTPTNATSITQQFLTIGTAAITRDTSTSNKLNGYLQDLRTTKGYARYVEGAGGNAGQMVFNGTNTLALPTAAFPTL